MRILQEQLLEIWERERKTAVFITHSIDEALFLSDRIIVMSPRPGRGHRVIDTRSRAHGRARSSARVSTQI